MGVNYDSNNCYLVTVGDETWKNFEISDILVELFNKINEEGDMAGYAGFKGLIGRALAAGMAKARDGGFHFRQLYWWRGSCIKLGTIIYKRENKPAGVPLSKEEFSDCTFLENTVINRFASMK